MNKSPVCLSGSNINRPLSVATSLRARLGSVLERCCGGVWRPFSTRRRTLPSSQLVGIKISKRAVQITVAKRVVMKFLTNEHVGPDEIYAHNTGIKHYRRHKWNSGIKGYVEEELPCKHKLSTMHKDRHHLPENIASVRELIECDCLLTVVEICQDIGTHISYGSVQSITKNEPVFWKVSARWVHLIPDPKPHSTALTQRKLAQMYWTALEHPPYCLNHSRCDYHMFGTLKGALGGGVSTMMSRSRISCASDFRRALLHSTTQY
jgi:hypothetical protein